MKPDACMCCRTDGNEVFDSIDGYDYFECRGCGSIFVDSSILQSMDQGKSIIDYDDEYWSRELSAARERAYGQSLARVSELLLYARAPVRRFIDIGTGAGYLLDALAYFLPSASQVFHGVEKFPPGKDHSDHPNYHIGTLGEAPGRFQAGTCIEVIEHLTPKMLRQLLVELKEKSEDSSIFLFNTGMPDYVRNDDRGYLDPTLRGHVFSYSLKAVEMLSADLGFSVLPLKGRSWAFLLEYNSTAGQSDDVSRRVWTAPHENCEILNDPQTGSVLYTLGMESARERADSVKTHVSALQDEVAGRDEAIAVLRRTVADRDKHLVLYQEEVGRRDGRIEVLQGMVDERDERSAVLQGIVDEREKWFAELQGRLAERTKQLAGLLATIAERDEKIAALLDKLVARDSQLEALRSAIAERDRHLALYGEEVARRDEEITALRNELVERDNQLEALRGAIAERDRHLALSGEEVARRHEEITALRNELAERDNQLEALRGTIAERDGHIALYGEEVARRDERIRALQDALDERERQIKALHASTSWRVTKPLRAAKGKLRTGT